MSITNVSRSIFDPFSPDPSPAPPVPTIVILVFIDPDLADFVKR